MGASPDLYSKDRSGSRFRSCCVRRRAQDWMCDDVCVCVFWLNILWLWYWLQSRMRYVDSFFLVGRGFWLLLTNSK